MSTMRNRKGAILALLVLAVIIVCGAIAAIRFTGKLATKWEWDMTNSGPWGSEGVWISEDGDIALICTASDDGYTVDARVLYHDAWEPATFEVVTQFRDLDLRLVIEDGHRILRGSADILDGGNALQVYDFVNYSDEEWLNRRLSVTFTKYSLEDGLLLLPFSYNP